MDSSIRTLTELLDMLKDTAKKDVATSTLSDAAQRCHDLDADIDRLDSIATSIVQHVVALEDRAKGGGESLPWESCADRSARGDASWRHAGLQASRPSHACRFHSYAA